MKITNIQEAKTHLSRLVELAAGGETVVIGKAGTPVAQLTAWAPQAHPRLGGGWQGQVEVSPDFNSADTVLEDLFYGTEEKDTVRVAEHAG